MLTRIGFLGAAAVAPLHARRRMSTQITDISQIDPYVLGQMRMYFENQPPATPISQIQGFKGFTAQSDFIATKEVTASVGYADLATVGPQVASLSAGRYVFLFGALAEDDPFAAGRANAWMSVEYDKTTGATDMDAIVAMSVNPAAAGVISYFGAATGVLRGDSNTVTAKYRVDVGAPDPQSAYFSNRHLIVFRYANI